MEKLIVRTSLSEIERNGLICIAVIVECVIVFFFVGKTTIVFLLVIICEKNPGAD